jgi:hypothetical protein
VHGVLSGKKDKERSDRMSKHEKPEEGSGLRRDKISTREDAWSDR